MKKQIKRLSPHQNGKVFGILSALSSLPFFLPWLFLMQFTSPQGGAAFPTAMVFIFPILYLIFGYVFIALGCIIYNFISKFTGGFEFETEERNE